MPIGSVLSSKFQGEKQNDQRIGVGDNPSLPEPIGGGILFRQVLLLLNFSKYMTWSTSDYESGFRRTFNKYEDDMRTKTVMTATERTAKRQEILRNVFRAARKNRSPEEFKAAKEGGDKELGQKIKDVFERFPVDQSLDLEQRPRVTKEEIEKAYLEILALRNADR